MDALYSNAWYFVTLVGQPEAWAASTLVAAVAYFILRNRLGPGKRKFLKRALSIYIPSVLITLAIALAIKSAVYVPRPCVCVTCPTCGVCAPNPYCDTDSSFPSGHASTIFAVFTSLYLGTRRKWILPLFIVPALVSASRYFLGVHTIADISAGAAIGIAVSMAVWIIYSEKFDKKKTGKH